jgi:Asp/Glu/hydantoin racemase
LRLLLINPNTSAGMTARLQALAQAQAGSAAEVSAVSGRFGHEVIASRVSFAVGAHAALDAWQGYLDQGLPRPQAVLLACFGDPGLAALREVAGVPVVGLADACLQQVRLRQRRFAILTAGAPWREMLAETVLLAGLQPLLCGIEVLETTGLQISQDPAGFRDRVQQGLDAALAQGVQSVVLGGAGFAGMAAQLDSGPAELIDGLSCGVQAALQVARNAPTP